MSLAVRERPPLRTTTLITTPSGRRYRWAQDDPDAANVPTGQRHSDTMPGGYETWSCALPRKPGVDYDDVERLSTVTVKGAGGRTVWEGRLDALPSVSGDQMAVNPAAVGWQAALDDDKSARMVYRDIDLSRWHGPAAQLQLNNAATFAFSDPSTEADQTTGAPAVKTAVTSPWATAPGRPISHAYYDASGVRLGYLWYAWKKNGNVNAADPDWSWFASLETDDIETSRDITANLRAAGPSSGTVTATATRKFAHVWFFFGNVANPADNTEFAVFWDKLHVHGDHGLPLQGVEPDAGLLASDIVSYAVRTWAPMLRVSVDQSSFVLPHLVFADATTAGEMVRQASRFELPDWGVWDNLTFRWAARGTDARFWRARIAPSELEETGPQVDRLWESIMVQYQDVDGSTRTVGPPGSGADTESSDLKDPDPENPANKLGLVRRDLLQMGTSTVAGATEVGRRFLSESRLLDRSGRARAVGYIEDDRGVLHPYHHVRAGDYVAFVDASDKSQRRIVRTEKDHDTRTVSMDLDAPPEGLQALLERLGVVLVPLGVGS